MSNFRRAAVAMLPLLIQAGGLQDLGALDRLLAAELGAEAGAPGGASAPVDRRLRLRACAGEVVVEPPVGGAVALRCTQPAWRIRVPVASVQPAADRTESAARAGPATPLVSAGQQVTAIVRAAGFTVSTRVTALERGALGQRIRLRGAGRSDAFTGVVLADGRVEISGLN